MSHRFRTILLMLAAALAATTAHADPNLVIVVRHAERASEPTGDPALTPAGTRRAEQLADLAAQAKVSGIVTTAYRRTRDTAQPLAKRLALTPVEVSAAGRSPAAHVEDILAALKRMTGTVLVVGHSNTVGPIVTALTGEPVVELCETSFSHVFIVSPANRALVKLRYGEPDLPPAPGCQ